jgi:hypothetical protein
MNDFWVSSGHHLLDRDEDGWLRLTDEFLKAYLARPELVPPAEACAGERALHAALLEDPRRAVSTSEIAAIADADARENWEVMLGFRDRLTAAPTLESAYLKLVRGNVGRTPSLFLHQLTQVVLRNALHDIEDPFVLRSAELFFRPQKASVQDGALMLADAEVIALHEEDRSSAPLVAMFSAPTVTELDVLDAGNAEHYFHRSDAFDMVLSLAGGPEARRGLARALELWVKHLLGLAVSIEPVAHAQDTDWAWFVGLDADATKIGNALWRGDEVSPRDLDRIVGIFRLTFREPDAALAEIGARPVWLIMALGTDNQLRLKPQNIVTGLPLAEAVS